MAKDNEQLNYTTFEGRTITNVDLLLREPKVQDAIRKLSEKAARWNKRDGVAVVRYRKPQ